jgi:hypothetical protein
MGVADLLVDGFDRVQGVVHRVVKGLTPEQLGVRIDGKANSICWLVWHLTRVQDDHLADASGIEQLWTADGWAQRFALPLDQLDIGYGHTFEQVSSVQVTSGDTLIDYHDAVHAQTLRYVRKLVDADLTRVVDDSYDPPVTLATRLISVLSDDLQHAGQAAFVRGLIL